MFPLALLSGSFSDLNIFTDQNSADDLRRTLCRSPKGSPCSTLLFGAFPYELHPHWPFQTPSSIFSIQGDLEPGNAFQIVNWCNSRAYLIYFLPLRDHCPSSLDVQCLANHCFTFFGLFYGCFRKESKSKPCKSVLFRSEGRDTLYTSLGLYLPSLYQFIYVSETF